MPALLITMSNPDNLDETLSINSSIIECSDKSNFNISTSGNCFFKLLSFSIFVPVAKTLPLKELNFLTNALPIPPEAPVINILLSLKFLHQ